MSFEEFALLLIAILLAAGIFYVSGAIVGQDWSASWTYILRVLLVSVIAVVVIPVFSDAANQFKLGELGLLLAFVLLIIVIRFVLVDELTVNDDWLASIVIALIGVVLIYIVAELASRYSHIDLLPIF
jgi:hypothetical protein